MESFLTPGFRFYPTEEELVSFYLHNKLEGGTPTGREDLITAMMDQIIPVLDIYLFNPWDLPQLAGEVCRRDGDEWFFFIPRQESEARGGRPKRLTSSGYWKATGSPGYVYSSNHRSIGVKRTMVFYNGRAPTGTKTDWKMNEYKAIHNPAASSSSSSSSSTTNTIPQLRQEFSLCRIYKRSKTLRSFDRRPQPRGVEMGQPVANAQPATEPQSLADQPNPSSNAPLMVTSSPDSSSSGDQRGQSSAQTTVQTNDELDAGTMEVAHVPMWDWEQLNWF